MTMETFEDSLFDIVGDDEPQVAVNSATYDPEMDDSFFGDSDPTIEPQTEEPVEEPEEEDGLLEKALRNRGIDPKNIQIVNEKGEVETISFSDLTEEEQLDILSDKNEEQSPISDVEMETINYLRANGITLEEFAKLQRDQAVADYIASAGTETDIDSYSDDEIIAYDFITRFGEEMTDEEIDSEIERLKQDEEAYSKRVNLLRTKYKEQELAAEQEKQKTLEQEHQAQEQELINAFVSAATNIGDIQGVILEDNDKEELLDFVLTRDAAHRTGFSKAMDNPDNVLKMAWYLLHGDEVFNSTVDYYKNLVAQSRRQAQPAPRAVRKPQQAKPKKSTTDDLGLDKYFK